MGEDIENKKGRQRESKQLRRYSVIRVGGRAADWAGGGKSVVCSGNRSDSGQSGAVVELRLDFLYKLDLEN